MSFSFLEFFSPWQLILLAFACVGGVWFLRPTASPYRDFPSIPRGLLPGKFAPPIERSLQLGYYIYTRHGRPYTIKLWGKDYLVLPPKYFSDLQSARQLDSSFHQALGNDFKEAGQIKSAINRGLNLNLQTLVPLLDEAVERSLEAEIGSIEGAKEFNAFKFISNLCHRVSCRFLLCDELSHDEEFLRQTAKFQDPVSPDNSFLDFLPIGPLRDLLVRPMSSYLLGTPTTTAKTVEAQVNQRQKVMKQEHTANSAPQEDCIGWALAGSAVTSQTQDTRQVAVALLQIFLAGSGSIAGLLTQMLYQLLMYNNYLEPLRSEARRATAEHGWTSKAIQNLSIQDSFIRELNRVNPNFSVICSRTVRDEPWNLSGGLVLPVGTRCIWPGKDIMRDPEYYDKPQEFDALRFANLARDTTQYRMANNKYGAGFVATTNLAFGYGAHACPGRYFALNLVKVMFSKLILSYDIEWSEARQERPKDREVEGHYAPNSAAKILIKRRVS